LRDFPDIHSASSATAERQERVCGRSHSTPQRRDALVVDIETDIKHGCLLKSMYLGTAATGFHITGLTEASFVVSTPTPIGPKLRLVDPTEASKDPPARVGVVGPTRARTR
jgi:hypothetical protein